jgi:hypothetical protein
MSKLFLVAAAVTQQLHTDGRWPPNNLNKTMGADYRYDINTMANFLTAVQDHLKHGTPSYDFQFDRSFVQSSLASTAGLLIGNVDAKTKDAKSAKPPLTS